LKSRVKEKLEQNVDMKRKGGIWKEVGREVETYPSWRKQLERGFDLREPES
jgi:hypothetical protein